MDPEYLLLDSDNDDEQSTETEDVKSYVKKEDVVETVQQKNRVHQIGDFKETVKFVRQVEKGIQDHFDDIVAFPGKVKRGIKEDISHAIDMIQQVEQNLHKRVDRAVEFSKEAKRNLNEAVLVAIKVEQKIEHAIDNIVEYSHQTNEDIKDAIKFAKKTEQGIHNKFDRIVNSETLQQFKVVLTSFRETSGLVLDLAKTSFESGLATVKGEALETSELIEGKLVPLAQEGGEQIKKHLDEYCDKCCEGCGTALFKVKKTVESGFEIVKDEACGICETSETVFDKAKVSLLNGIEIAKDELLDTSDDIKYISGKIKNFVGESLAIATEKTLTLLDEEKEALKEAIQSIKKRGTEDPSELSLNLVSK